MFGAFNKSHKSWCHPPWSQRQYLEPAWTNTNQGVSWAFDPRLWTSAKWLIWFLHRGSEAAWYGMHLPTCLEDSMVHQLTSGCRLFGGGFEAINPTNPIQWNPTPCHRGVPNDTTAHLCLWSISSGCLSTSPAQVRTPKKPSLSILVMKNDYFTKKVMFSHWEMQDSTGQHENGVCFLPVICLSQLESPKIMFGCR